MRQALDKWISKGNQDLTDWKVICGKLSDNDVDKQSVCVKFAELYESRDTRIRVAGVIISCYRQNSRPD